MKIKLTEEQKAAMGAIFENMNKLSKDGKFMQMLKYAEKNYDKNNDDCISLVNLTENIIDTAKCNFNYYNIGE